MSNVVEMVARAICSARMVAEQRGILAPSGAFLLHDEMVEIRWREYEHDARKAILALREPTEEMVSAAFSEHDRCDGRTDLDEVWRNMIDAALK